MIQGFLILLLCLLLGEGVVFALDAPIPGSVIGMVILLCGLMAVGEVPSNLRLASEGLLKILPLLLVPAGVGLIVHIPLLSQYWLILLLVLFVSTLATMLTVALLLKSFSKKPVGK